MQNSISNNLKKVREMKNLALLLGIVASATLVSCQYSTDTTEATSPVKPYLSPGTPYAAASSTPPASSQHLNILPPGPFIINIVGRKKREAESEQSSGTQFSTLARRKRQAEEVEDEDETEEMPPKKGPPKGKGPKGKGPGKDGPPGHDGDCPPPPPPHCLGNSGNNSNNQMDKMKNGANKGKSMNTGNGFKG